MLNPRTPTPDDDAGWVTFSRCVIDGRLVLVQKKDGSTRTVLAGRPAQADGRACPGSTNRSVTT